MKISVSKVDGQQNRELLGSIDGRISFFDEYLYEFSENNTFTVDDDIYEIKAGVATNNFKGNLSIKKNGDGIVNSLMTVDDTFLLMIKISSKYWIELIVSSS